MNRIRVIVCAFASRIVVPTMLGVIATPAMGTGDCAGGHINDDGTAENYYSPNGPILERFVPPTYPYAYDQVCVCWRSAGDTDVNFDILIYDDDGPDGGPGTLLLETPGTATGLTTDPAGDFQHTDIWLVTPVIHDGVVYIGVQYSPKSHAVTICADESLTTPISGGYGKSVVKGEGLVPLQMTFFDYRAVMIRTTGRAVEDCNNNNVPDVLDIVYHQTSADCNRNVIPDECETADAYNPAAAGVFTDDCADAPFIEPGFTYTNFTNGITTVDVQFCHSQYGVYNVWSKYRPSWDGQAQVRTLQTPMPTMVLVFDSCPASGGEPIACNWPNPSGATFNVARGETYWFMTSGYGFATGPIVLDLVGPRGLRNSSDYNRNGVPDECDCLFDVDNDGTVGMLDFIAAVAAIGPCGAGPCPADVDGDGVVDNADLALILNNQGPCLLGPILLEHRPEWPVAPTKLHQSMSRSRTMQ